MFGCLMELDMRGMLLLARNGTIAALCQGVIWESMLFIQREAGAVSLRLLVTCRDRC